MISQVTLTRRSWSIMPGMRFGIPQKYAERCRTTNGLSHLSFLDRPFVDHIYRFILALLGSRFVIHLVGKFRRFYLVEFRRGYVRRQLALRKGECRQCGQCCSLLLICPLLTRQGLCRIYHRGRWKMCKAFPIDERDISDVVLTGGTCGYYFESDKFQFMD